MSKPFAIVTGASSGIGLELAAICARGQGKIIERVGAEVAAYRDASGAVTLRSATCTHVGCIVAWTLPNEHGIGRATDRDSNPVVM